MPAIGSNIPKAVFYLFRLHPVAREADGSPKLDGPLGTGVIVSRHRLAHVGHYYAISNIHVVKGLGASIIRINTIDGKTRTLQFAPSEWELSREGDDLCGVDITDRLNAATDEVSCVPETDFLASQMIQRYRITIGEDAFMIGLFASHHGGERNVPMTRFGNLSMLASPDAPIKQLTGAMRPCHVLDVRSRTGFSGSPVFIFRTQGSDLSQVRPGTFTVSPTGSFLFLLGVHVSQFNEPIKVRVTDDGLEAYEALAPGELVREGDTIALPSSMTTIAPAWAVSALLDMREFEDQRLQREQSAKN